MKRNTITMLCSLLMLSACGASDSGIDITADQTVTERGPVLDEKAIADWNEGQYFQRTIREFQNNGSFFYSETVNGSDLIGVYQFTDDNLSENGDLLCASIGMLIYYGGIDEYNAVDTIKLTWLDWNSKNIGSQVFKRDATNGFYPAGEFVWKNAEYKGVCENNLPDLNN